MDKLLLHAQALALGYQGKPVVQDVEIPLHAGEILALIGPNGAGKSTVLKGLIRQLSPLSGTIVLDGTPLAALSPKALAREMSVVLTGQVHPERMTCEEVVSAGRYPYTGMLGLLSQEDWMQVERAMSLVGVDTLAQRLFSTLSDGQRQRVMLARAICQQPKVLVLDEPTSYLDIRYKLELLDILRSLAAEGTAVILTLHELELAQRCADMVLCVKDGHAQRLGTPEEIFQGEYIRTLYDLPPDSYNPLLGTLELSAPKGTPDLFVIGGGGAGIPVYRALQRQSIPFYAGVLHENDIELPVASSLAALVFISPPFEPLTGTALSAAASALEGCTKVLCPLNQFGSMNQGNRRLLTLAGDRLTTLEQLSPTGGRHGT